jgi:hypothetical protein
MLRHLPFRTCGETIRILNRGPVISGQDYVEAVLVEEVISGKAVAFCCVISTRRGCLLLRKLALLFLVYL